MIKRFFNNSFYLLFLFFFGLFFVSTSNLIASTLDPNELYCFSDIAIDLDTGNLLYGKNETEKIYPASTTKILTAILTIENMDLTTKITVSQNAVNATPYGSSVMGVKAGEIFTVEQLLYGLMLPSGNDAAIVLAEAISGNVTTFVEMMNQKLKELNLNNTHFVNPHGFHDDNHYSTALDMANLLRYCLQNPTFKKILSTLTYEIPPTNVTDTTRTFRNTSRILDPLYPSMYDESMIGGKTGYTLEANGTFVGFASKDEKNIIVCAFNGLQNIDGLQARFIDAKKIAAYCFEHFSKTTFLTTAEFQKKIYDLKEKRYYLVGLADDITGLVPNDTALKVNYDIKINYNILPILSMSEETSIHSSKVGTCTFHTSSKMNGFTYDLIYLGSGEYLPPKHLSFPIQLVYIVLLFLGLLGILQIFKTIHVKQS